MDCISVMRKRSVYEKRKREFLDLVDDEFDIKFFGTSIWDDSLYKAWKVIVSSIIIDMEKIEKGLKLLMEACDVDEINLFDKKTFLNICSVSKNNGVENEDKMSLIEGNENYEEEENSLNLITDNNKRPKNSRQEKISKALKKLKLSIDNSQKSQLRSFYYFSNKFSFFINELTEYTFVMMVSNKPDLKAEFLALNIDLCKEEFENLLAKNV